MIHGERSATEAKARPTKLPVRVFLPREHLSVGLRLDVTEVRVQCSMMQHINLCPIGLKIMAGDKDVEDCSVYERPYCVRISSTEKYISDIRVIIPCPASLFVYILIDVSQLDSSLQRVLFPAILNEARRRWRIEIPRNVCPCAVRQDLCVGNPAIIYKQRWAGVLMADSNASRRVTRIRYPCQHCYH